MVDAAPHALPLAQLLRAQRLQLFYGDLHNHTGYSDGVGRPEDALRQMRARGLHFAAITDHGEFFDRETLVRDSNKWAAVAAQVAAISDDAFVAIRGFEWSSPRQGHSNVWWSERYTGYLETGDTSMDSYYRWLTYAEAIPGANVLAGFNHPGRELACFDGCSYVPALDDRLVTLECFNRDDDYGEVFFTALDRGWHVGAIGVSDHHEDDWGSPRLPRAGLLAPSLTRANIEAALSSRHVFATKSPTLRLLVAGNGALMGARLALDPDAPLDVDIWCDDAAASQDWTRLELWTNGGTLVEAWETRGLHNLSRRISLPPGDVGEQWYVVCILREGESLAYSSPIWARWR